MLRVSSGALARFEPGADVPPGVLRGVELDEQIVDTAGSIAWASDQVLFYVKHDEAQILQSASLKANEDGRAAMIVRDFWGIAAAASASAIAAAASANAAAEKKGLVGCPHAPSD